MRGDALAVVTRFARALDEADYGTASACLAEHSRYNCRGELFGGPTAIIASYRRTGEQAKVFDSIRTESHVDRIAVQAFRIRFVDHIRHARHDMTFRCEQHVGTDGEGRIIWIEHVDAPEQLAALKVFKSRVRCGARDDD
jgi:hypothetical protein